MSVNWQWKDKMGELTFKGRSSNGKEGFGKLNLYAGNCLGVLIYEPDETHYEFSGFWNDTQHLRNCLEASKEHSNIYDNVVNIRLNTFFEKEAKTIATEFTKAFIKQHLDLTIEYYYKDVYAEGENNG